MTLEAIGGATMIHGDCADYLEACLADLGERPALVMDPPYKFVTKGAGTLRKKRGYLDKIEAAGLTKGFDLRILERPEISSAVVFCHNDQLHEILPILKRRFKRHAVCSWHKLNPMPVANKHYVPDTEFYCHAWDEGAHPLGSLAQKRRYHMSGTGRNKHGHNTEKPLSLMRKIVANVNATGILDPFAGTGSTGVACLEAGIPFMGIEIVADHYEAACRRLEATVAEIAALEEARLDLGHRTEVQLEAALTFGERLVDRSIAEWIEGHP